MRGGIGLAVVALAGLAALTACASPSPTPTSSGSAGAISEEICPVLDLRSPSGESLDLTGRWRAYDGATYYVRQYRSCIWLTGFSVGTGAPGGDHFAPYANALFANLARDFTFHGYWADTPFGEGRGLGAVTWEIVYDEVDGEEVVTMAVATTTSGSDDLYLVRPESPAEFSVELQSVTGCPTGQAADGATYELIVGDPAWSFIDTLGMSGPEGILIRETGALEVHGELARGTTNCATGWILIADEIELPPAP
jgi:hypothetical protein